MYTSRPETIPLPALSKDPRPCPQYRTEMDSLGERQLPASAYYGVQTQRALENFGSLGKPLADYPALLIALATIKRACARANANLGTLPAESIAAVEQACIEIIDGLWHEQFPVSLLQGGAGTSTNMNANEVITNRALELLGHARGDYQHLHPNDHVNAGQSTNDVFPSALRLALYRQCDGLLASLARLAEAFSARAKAFSQAPKVGRTQLQDAVPMSAGDELQAFAASLHQCRDRIERNRAPLLTINLGGTAIGSCINSSAAFRENALNNLRALTGLPLAVAPNLYQASWDTGDLVDFSSGLKRLAITLSKISSDLRLLSSGPRAGLAELQLPKQQPGSSIMPGKVNPVLPELINQIAFDVIGRDHSLGHAAEQGQLQLNAFEPLMAECLFTSLERLLQGCDLLRTRCIDGLDVNTTRCSHNLQHSHALATQFNGLLGYSTTSKLISEAEQSGVNFIDLLRQKALVPEAVLTSALVQPPA